ncbi:dienelactone hydrolase [Sulfitobacter sp. LCG007]
MAKLSTLATAAALVAGPALCENHIDLIRPDAPQLAQPGRYPVGVKTLELVNPDQIDIIHVTGKTEPLYDRPFTLEVWYPATQATQAGGTYRTLLRDGATEITLSGRAHRDAEPADGETFPLIVISHGYPGNRLLLSHLGENLASKGYVAVSIDHADSTYADQGSFASTLFNRPFDQRFVIDSMAAPDGPLGSIVNPDRIGVIGYSMGAYGALVLGGAGLSKAAPDFSWAPPNRLLARLESGSESHEALFDPRVKAMVVIGPWGGHAGLWEPRGLAGLRVPTLFMAGSSDDVSIYASIQGLFESAVGTERHLLTFHNAGHNAAAPMPAPSESWEPVETLDFVPFEHYADPVWDTVRMNNIAQHFATAFFGLHLKGAEEMVSFLDLVPNSEDGVVALSDDGRPSEDHSYWEGFAPHSAKGLSFVSRARGE